MGLVRFLHQQDMSSADMDSGFLYSYDFNNDGGVYYMVLEFIPGETLQDRLKRLNESDRKLSLKEVLNFTLDTSEAIGYAHQRGMIHRDIKPSNILVSAE